MKYELKLWAKADSKEGLIKALKETIGMLLFNLSARDGSYINSYNPIKNYKCRWEVLDNNGNQVEPFDKE